MTAPWGDRDRLVPLAHLAGVRAALPQVEIHICERTGHHPQRERPEQLSALIERSSVPARTPSAVCEPPETA